MRVSVSGIGDRSRFNKLQGNVFVASTYKSILEHVSRTALQDADIHFNQPVVKIESKPREDPTARHQITLTTATGQTSHFNEVVVTCPLGWLKRNKSAFNPDLPPRLIQAIDSISYGRLEKIFATFPQAFWHTDTPSSNPEPEKTGYGQPTFVQFFTPTYTSAPDDANKSIPWNQECLSLSSLPPSASHPTLLFYTHGPCGSTIVSKIHNLSASSPEYYTTLDQILKPFYSRLPGYKPTSPSCVPLAFHATTWQTDPYAGNGSYSNFQTGLTAGDTDIEVLRAGVCERGVWFAGEHTAPFVALGTTTGAYWSGERAAGQICEVYGLGKVGMHAMRDDSLPSGVGMGK